jgi:hypothetical protein
MARILYSQGTGHKNTVYCVAYARDGKRFASGGYEVNIPFMGTFAQIFT